MHNNTALEMEEDLQDEKVGIALKDSQLT